MTRGRELSDGAIGSIVHALREYDPDSEIAAQRLRNFFARREGKPEEEYKQRVIKEITYGSNPSDRDGVQRMRLVRDNFYVRLQMGTRYKDKPKREFTITRQLALSAEQFPLALKLLNSIKTPPQSPAQE